MNVLTTTQQLNDACTELAKASFVTIDTEFMREDTFWSELCLIQMASDDLEVVVDPLADNIDLAPFFDLMTDEGVVKVFHAARQDIEIVYNLSKRVPRPLFDTQIAAMVCGFGDSIGYSNLVKRILNIDIDKSSQFTDWRSRPLSNKQLTYAQGDVTHLRGVYRHLDEQLSASGRTEWVREEMEVLMAPATYEMNPDDAWKRLKMRVKSRSALAVMMSVAKWREATAQKQNTPRNRVLKDDAIYDIANQSPRSLQQLSRLRTIHDGVTRSSKGKDIVAMVEEGLARDPATVPAIRRSGQPTPQVAAISDLLRVLLKATAAKHDVAPKLIATSDDLEKLAQDDNADISALKGWRREIFGEPALAIKHGRLALAMNDGGVVAIPTPLD